MLTHIKKKFNAALFALAYLPAAYVSAVDTQPNILILLVDDLGYADVGFMEHAEDDIHTPNIDTLASDGVVLTSGYAAHAYCGPSRAGLMSGRYQHNFGSHFNHAAYQPGGVGIDETFFSTVLQDAGYNTGLIGKWHLGEEAEYQPNHRGFDYFYGMLGGGHVYHTSDFVRVANFNPSRPGWDYRIPLMENLGFAPETGYENNLYITDMFTDAGVDFIERAESNDDQPFFLMMSYNAPHTPEEAKASDVTELRQILGSNASSGDRFEYAAMVYGVDRGVEAIVNKLKETDEFDNTIIVFLSDNGGRLDNANASNTPLRSGKTSNFEGGIRVPMFIHWPNGDLPNGSTYEHVISSLDLYPTLINLAGAEAPAEKVLDGKEILEDIRAGRNTRPTEPLYFMMHIPRQSGGLNQAAAVLNGWKWFTTGNGNWQLFNLDNDIGERNAVRNNNNHNDLLDSLYQWTWTHVRPEFFDSPSYGWEAAWDSNNMPNYGKTFPNRYNESDYNGSTPTPTPTPTVTPSTGTNLLSNPGFEAGANAWALGGSSSISNNAHSGSNAVLINGAGNTNQNVTLAPNTEYTLTVWGRVGSAGQSFYVGVTNATTSTFIRNTVFNTTAYSEGTITFTTSGNASDEYRIWMWNNQGGQYYTDDYSLTSGTPTPAVTPTPQVTPTPAVTPTPQVTPTPVVTPTPETANCNGWVSTTGVTLSPATATLSRGDTLALSSAVIPSCSSVTRVTYRSSNSAVAIVNSSGVVTARGPGTVVITVRSKNGGREASSTISVN